MSRLVLEAGKQRSFLDEVRAKTGLSFDELAKRSGQLRKELPEKYPSVSNKKKIQIPALSESLAEFVGIILGDGGLTHYQTTVSFNSSTDSEYIAYVSDLFNSLFGLSVFVKYREGNSCFARASSVELTELLVSMGLCVGDKIRNRANVPAWVFERREYMRGCIRGLIDTDGNVARKNYHANTLAWQISFRNESQLLLESARRILIQLGFTPSRITVSNNIHLTRKDDVRKYIIDIGFSNSKHLKRIQNIKDQFRRGAGVADQGCLLSS